MTSPYEAIGQEKLYAVIDRFYDYVKADDRINHLFPAELNETARKQKQFLTQFLGGPSLYTEEHGHPMLRMRHLPFQITPAARDAWLENMHRALDDFEIDEPVKNYIFERLSLTATHMVNTE
ncbi:globin [Macrococcus equipercicus]|uniref:Globin n=1 Tax=Macrococcus equipercicus TaxID=69967 RepID=A0A9Q9F1Y4_9STAP|nr:globin [Macrococcus equipercicus]KAA1042792.1 globin [Macrococcus equipercicus]UTH14457.1 globin [Macrococcus equipercicus]